MSDLDRLIALAGLATDDVAEGAYNETKMVCKDCGDELHKPTTDCPHDSHDEDGDHWVEVDIDGDGDADLKVNMEAEEDCDCDCGESPCKACGKTHHDMDEDNEWGQGDLANDTSNTKFWRSANADAARKRHMQGAKAKIKRSQANSPKPGEFTSGVPTNALYNFKEAVGESAECFYQLQDDFAGGECPSGGHKELIDNLVRFLSGDQLEEFCDDFRRHYDMNEATLDEDDLDENAFNQAAAAAARAGKEEFEFGGKTYKTKMDKSTAHKLDDDVQMESAEINFTPEEEKRLEMYDLEGEFDSQEDYEKTKAWCAENLNSTVSEEIEEMMEKAMSTESVPVDDALYDFADIYEDVHLFGSDALIEAYRSVRAAAGEEDDVAGFVEACKSAMSSMKTNEEVVAEAPTMDTTQLITLLKNAGLTEEAIEEKLTEWANTPSPEMANEQEPTEHGDAYDFAQSVNLSLKRYLDAEDMKVGLKEHKVEDLREAYEAKKNK